MFGVEVNYLTGRFLSRFKLSPQAPSTEVEPFALTIDDNGDRMNIGHRPTVSPPFGMADIMTEER
jgi:hypothetical protein